MFAEEPNFMPYPPGNRVIDVVRRIHEGKTPQKLTLTALVSLGSPEGSADRVQKALRFLGLISPEFDLTDEAVRLRRATSDEYAGVLAEIVRGAYEPVFEAYDPATASGIDLNNAFKPYDPAGQRPQMIGLFMALSREAGLAPDVPIRKPGRPPSGSAPSTRQAKSKQNGVAKGIQVPITPPPPEGRPAFTKSVKLRDASGSITLTVSVDLMDLEGENRIFVFDLIDKLKAYEKENPATPVAESPGAAES